MERGINDDEVIGRIRNGDTESYNVLATRYHRRLQRLAQKYLRNEADAEDAVQRAHLLAIRHIDQYAGRSGYFAWMSSIVVNEALTQIRRTRNVEWADDTKLMRLSSPMRSPERQAVDRDTLRVIRTALEGLPPAYGPVFRLREMEELSTAETGERLGLTEECVKSRLFRAKGMLRTRLRPFFKGASLLRHASNPGVPTPEPTASAPGAAEPGRAVALNFPGGAVALSERGMCSVSTTA